MRYAAPSTISSRSLSASQKTRSHARDSRREVLARTPDNQSNGVLASVVSSRRLRAQATSANLLTVVAPIVASSNTPPKHTDTTHLMNDSLPFGQVSFCEWYETLTLEKRRALMMAMIEVCKERGAASAPNGRGKTSSPDSASVDPNDIAFQWRVEGDGEDLVLQFSKWYVALDEVEQDTALAYSGLADGEKIADLPTEEEVKNVNKRNGPVAEPLAKVPSFVEGSSNRSTPRDAANDPTSIAAKGKTRRLTREASSEVFAWAQSFAQRERLVVPNVPVTQPVHALAVVSKKKAIMVPQSDYPMVDFPLPKPPKRGYRAKLTRNGTLILDNRGKPKFEKIPADVLYPQKERAQPN
ncbi:hypothetical protein E1B28_010817 [Marasmius oreades]|uniref:Uncharacterized protein n=1 Tax=Marasmius oreades TaxID=181124 RepID=A0A9P7RTG8_9AGAR|nr:uncharacterized protein E1B28_010817 [Marasmius oreades]KAG7089108.1 hypothetical protein E1B28_010817 [Marasmius oreades]